MALKWAEPCDQYANVSGASAVAALGATGWTTSGPDSEFEVLDNGGAFGDGFIKLSNTAAMFREGLSDAGAPNPDRVVVSFFFTVPQAPPSGFALVAVNEGGPTPTGGVLILLYRIGGIAIVDETDLVIANLGSNLWNEGDGLWNHLELQLDYDEPGNLTVLVNEVEVFNGNVESGAAQWDRVQFAAATDNFVGLDDIIVGNDLGGGGAFSTLEGQKRLHTLLPLSDDTNDSATWQPEPSSPATYFDKVDDPIPGGDDADATYVNMDESASVNNELTRYNMQDLPTGTTGIVVVSSMHSMRSVDGVPVSGDIHALYDPDGVGSSIITLDAPTLTTSYEERGNTAGLDDNPVTTIPWTEADINLLKFGQLRKT